MYKFPYGGYAAKTLRIDLTRKKIRSVPLSKPDCVQYLGGRGMDAKALFDFLSPEIEPLHPRNLLCISTGPLTGLLGPTTGRVNVASRSPLTRIYGNSNAGSHFGPELKYAGYDRIEFVGRAKTPSYLVIEDSHVELRSAAGLWGRGVIETSSSLHEEHGHDAKLAVIGPAAERGVLYGSVIFDFWDAAGRTGMGTVMASKNLKAIVVSGTGALKVANPKEFYRVIEDGWQALLEDEGFQTGEHSSLGTAVCVGWGNAQGWLPTRNFRESVFEGAEEISGEEFRDRFSTKLAPIPGGRACFSCPNRCKRFGRIESGKYAGTKGGIEFEGIAAFGSKCGVSELDAVFHAYMLANDYGMDCISCGNTIALLMELHEHGLLSHEELEGIDLHFGNSEAMIEMVHRLGSCQGKLGAWGAQGSAFVAKKIGKGADKYLNVIKNLETIACDPRAAKGFGFGYAVASRGSDHLRAHPVFEMLKMDEKLGKQLFGSTESVQLRKYGGKVQMVVWHENLAAVTDSLGSCRFMHASYYIQYPVPELRGKKHSLKYHDWFSAATGIELSYEELLTAGDRIINIERALNVRYGIRKKDDTLPRRFLTQQLPSGPAKGELFSAKELARMLDEYYQLRGWDCKMGLQKRAKLLSLGMKDVAGALEKQKLLVL